MVCETIKLMRYCQMSLYHVVQVLHILYIILITIIYTTKIHTIWFFITSNALPLSISGRVNWWQGDQKSKGIIWRFGHRASTPNIKIQSSLAFMNDIGISNPLAMNLYTLGYTGDRKLTAVNQAVNQAEN